MEEQHYAFQEWVKLRKASKNLRLYALVDGIQYDRAIGEELKREKGVYPLLSQPEDKAILFAGPWLLDINILPEDYLLKLRKLETESPAVSWIISEYDVLPLAHHLENGMIVTLPSKQAGLFRFYDCRVLQKITALLSQEQLALLIQEMTRWIFYHEGKTHCYQYDDGYFSIKVLENNSADKETLS